MIKGTPPLADTRGLHLQGGDQGSGYLILGYSITIE